MNIVIIGGSGNMGKWFARYLLKEGFPVIITGSDQDKLHRAGIELGVSVDSNIAAVQKSDVVMLSVPPNKFEQIVKEIAPYIDTNQIVVDITSVKMMPVEVMHRYIKKGTILGTHPVFGPGAKDVANQNFVLTPMGNKETELATKVKVYLEDRKAHVALMSPKVHDETMTVVLGLAHFIAIVTANTLLNFDDFQEMKKISGTTFKLLYTLMESVISEDPQLYASLQMSLPDANKIEEQFIKNAQVWAEVVKHKDVQGFAVKMHGLREKLEKTDPSFRCAYDNMYRVNDILTPQS